MIEIKDPKDCCGCTACASICAHNAITMQPDVLGFLYPKVDPSKCANCGLCEEVCQFNDNYDRSLNLPQPIAYAVRHKDFNEIMRSRSGAAFIAISDYIIEQGGVIYGAGYKDHFCVVHKRATTKEERDEFRGSKYVQSDLTGVFQQVKKDLKNGLKVIFSGTPCQTSGLNGYVGKRLRENLYLIDIVCHGVPGPYIWRDYLAYLEKKHGSKIVYVNFRDKEKFGWKAHKETYKFEGADNKVVNSIFTYMFYQHIIFRHSCGVCHFTNLHRPSDITIADYWGWQRTDPNFNIDDKGCSLILCNTEKGRLLFEAVKDKMHIIPAELVNVMQGKLSKPSSIHSKRIMMEKDYAKHGFEHAMRKYGMMGWRRDLRLVLKKIKTMISKQFKIHF